MSPEQQELLRAGLNLTVAIVTLGLGWAVSQRLTVYWNLRQKLKENDLSAAHEFHRLYGEFFAVWKLWNYHLNGTPPSGPEMRLEVLRRACAAEGSMESLFVRLASSRNLNKAQTALLGRFRQGYQSLRQAIRDGRPLDWRSSDHGQYRAFKTLATEVAQLILTEAAPTKGAAEAKASALIEITSNEWEGKWA